MAEFSPSDAALEGFRIGRENPAGLAVWTILYFAASLFSGMLLIRTGAAQGLADLVTMSQAAQPDPAQMAVAWQQLGPALLPSYLPLIVVQLLIQAAVLRVILRPQSGRAYLRVSLDEILVLAAFVIVMAITLAGIIVLSTVGAFLGLAGLALALLAGMAWMVFVSIRLSLIYPQAVADGSVSPRRAWALTRGRFWPVFGAQALAVIFFVIVALLGSVVAYAIRTLGGVAEGPPTTMAGLMEAGSLGARAVESLLQALGLVLLSSPAAVIYRKVSGRGAAEAF